MKTSAPFLLLLVLTACSTTSPSVTEAPLTTLPTPATTSTNPSTAFDPTTSTEMAPATTEYPPGPFNSEALGYGPAPLPGSDGAGGSGCAPGTDALPDGVWFGFVVDRSDIEIQFDLACWWSGERANEIARQRGAAEVPVPNDYYITNDSEQVRTITISPGTAVAHLDYTEKNTSGDPYVVMTFGDWGGLTDYLNCDFDSGYEPYCLAWLFINNGVVTEMAEQYVP